MSLLHATRGLTVDENGIWRSNQHRELSYPEEGNEHCHALEDSSFWFRHRNNCIVAMLERFPPTGPILDVGGGNGYVARRMLDEGFDATLLEPGPVGALLAKTTRDIPEVFCATLEGAQFASESIGAIGCFDVLEHMADDHALIAEAHRVLAPGGLLYASVPAHRWLWSASDVVARHHRRYDRGAILDLLGPKFELLYATHIFTALTLPILAFRAMPFALGIAKSEGVLSSETEHGVRGGVWVRFLDRLLARELECVARGGRRRFGASMLVVARRRALQPPV
ncbi:MAG: methyltransferase domain-containing protein [Thermoanaerobaculia bacterium]